MSKYKLTFTLEITGQDDPDARKQAKDILGANDKVVPDAEMKLQKFIRIRLRGECGWDESFCWGEKVPRGCFGIG